MERITSHLLTSVLSPFRAMAVHCLSGHWCLISGTTSFLMMTSILVITLPIYPLVCFLLIQAEELQPGYSVSNYMFVAKVRERTAWRSLWVHYIKCGWPFIWISFSSLVLRWSWGISGCLEILQLGIITAYCYQRGEPRQWEWVWGPHWHWGSIIIFSNLPLCC